LSRKRVGLLESRVNIGIEKNLFGDNISEKKGYMDLFYKGNIIIEMKSPGSNKKDAYIQAKEYAENLKDIDLPYCILISDFKTFDYYYLDENKNPVTFLLEDLPNKVELFGFLAGYKNVEYKAVNPVDIQAAEYMGELHDALKENKYDGHELEMYLVRLLFCLFADDSGIFDEKKIFYKYMSDTKEDGSNLAQELGLIFEMLNKPLEKRQINRDEIFKKFPYVNGGLFEERLSTAAFNSKMRETLIKCCKLDWSQIKPEIFGAMFQSIKSKEARRELGEHYTSEKNILKVIKPLFLDDLWTEYNSIIKLSIVQKKQKLLELHNKIQKLKFLDPACGCGNFLVVSYRELRLLEIEILVEYLNNEKLLDIELMVRVNVDQFYGIEKEEFPAQIAKSALWLVDHLMNNIASEKLGKYIRRIPLTATPNIVIGNALNIDWEKVVPKDEISYILGNPPFIGSRMMNKQQKKEVEKTFNNLKYFSELDYVTCWYKKASQYIQNTNIEVGFVSTNSICQGLHVLILWPELINNYNIHINFAHQTFKWSNEAKRKAAVYCVIIGFSLVNKNIKKLYQYITVKSEPVEISTKYINSYLVEGENIFIKSRTTSICNAPEIKFGSMAADGGFLLFTPKGKDEFLKKEPKANIYFRRIVGSEEFINNKERWCLWLVDIEPSVLRNLKYIVELINKVKDVRKKSARPHLANIPHLFAQIAQPKEGNYIVIPKTSSERRKYIPMGFLSSDVIASDLVFIIPNANTYHFGILTSTMHMTWTRYVCGRLKSDYRYSKDIVYNNFPWPKPTEKQITEIKKLSQKILEVRLKFPKSSLADLYDPLTMPLELLKAHQKLDKAVENAYGRIFSNDSERITYLFELYNKLDIPIVAEEKKRGKGRKNRDIENI